jgi:oxygen-independent coproporphyrinogen-3 oxidase
MNGNAVSGKNKLDQQDIVFEFLLNALRLKSGSDIETFTKNTGLDFEVLKNAVKDIDTSLLFIDKNTVRTTDRGFIFLNEILEELLEE